MRLARAGGDRAVEPLRVEHERGERRAAVAVERREHLLRAGHLRHELGVHEARRLDAAQPGGGEPAAQLGARRRREHRRVVLQAVARAHVAERDHRVQATRALDYAGPVTPSLSLPAELLLLSFDPATRQLYRVRRGRLEVALVAADGGDAEGSRLALRRRGRDVLRRALAELQAAGLAEPGRTPALADRAALARRYERLAAGMRANEFAEERDRRLVVLLASTGALAQRLRGRDPHWYKRMVTGLIPEEDPGGASFALPASVIALALAADLAFDGGSDGGGGSGFDGGGGGDGGFDAGSFSGSDGGSP